MENELRKVIFKKREHKSGEPSGGYFHQWVKSYFEDDNGHTQESPQALIEDEEGGMHKVEIYNFNFRGEKGDPDRESFNRKYPSNTKDL